MSGINLSPTPETHYKVECFGPDGLLKWVEDMENIVVTAGLNKLLDATFKTGLTTPTWFIGLKGTGTVVLADVMSSHAGWSDITSTTASNGTRPAYTPGVIAAGSVSNSGAVAVFSVNATITVFGCFLTDSATVAGTTGTLYGAGDFAASRSVASGDVLNVTVTTSVS